MRKIEPNPDAMPPEEFIACLDRIGWTQRGVAEWLAVPESRVRRWAAGDYPVPEVVGEWLRKLAAAHEAHPPPVLA